MKLFSFHTFIFLFVLHDAVLPFYFVLFLHLDFLHYIFLSNKSLFFSLVKQTSKYSYRYHEIEKYLKNRLTVEEVLSCAAFFKFFCESSGSIYLRTQTLMFGKGNLKCLQHTSEFRFFKNGTLLLTTYLRSGVHVICIGVFLSRNIYLICVNEIHIYTCIIDYRARANGI